MIKEKNIEEIIRYIIAWLLRTDDEDIINSVTYTSDISQTDGRHKLYIRASRFFEKEFYGTPDSLPALPLKTLNEIPVLYGESKIEQRNNSIILHADLIAGTYFLISRYEEMLRPDVRDKHGRFTGKDSLPGRAGFIHRPILEEYGALLRQLLNLEKKEPQKGIAKIYLTHDVDILAHYKNLKSVTGALLRFYKSPGNSLRALKTYFGSIESDPWYQFPRLFEQAETLNQDITESILFIKPGGDPEIVFDRPIQNVFNKDYQNLFELCSNKKVKIGLHSSYAAGQNGELIAEEKVTLEKATQQKINFNRHHYLRNREPEDYHFLIKHDISDDFSMGFADLAGFRLGTCRPVRWIDPKSRSLTPLTLHPLPLMDNTFSEVNYMNMNLEEARDYAVKIIDRVNEHRGELVLLFHNTSFDKKLYPYTQELYQELLSHINRLTQ